MQLFLIRHAIAEPPQEGQPDALRPLAPEGKKKFHETVQGMEKIGIKINHVFHSPWLRAVQTASMLKPLAKGGVEVAEGLASPVDALWWEGLPASDAMAWVGHQPWMSEWVALLVTGSVVYAPHFPFKKGALWWLEGELALGGMRVVAAVPPKILRVAGA